METILWDPAPAWRILLKSVSLVCQRPVRHRSVRITPALESARVRKHTTNRHGEKKPAEAR
jgi:hypothetical protein